MNWPQVYLGVALTTLATLLLELSLTRIFSVVFYYHFAFLAISIALFGLAAGGIISYAFSRAQEGPRTHARAVQLGRLAIAASLSVVAVLTFVLSRRDDGPVTLAAIFLACAVPFTLAGVIVALVVGDAVERIDRVYFGDLLGAAIGCSLLVPFLNSFGGPNTVIVAAVFYAISASVWFSVSGRALGRVAGVTLALGLAALVAINIRRPFLDVHYAKGAPLTGETFVKWNSFSRTAIRANEIVIDADASSAIANFDLEHLSDQERRDLTLQGPALAYQLRPRGKALIIGPGGGWDVARALAAGSTQVTAVEINPIIAETIMRRQFARLSRGLYLRPEVHIVVNDGRSFLRQSDDSYDVLQATLVDTWASTSAGAFALSENSLYTVEAFTDYLEHLRPGGVLSFTRWGFDPPRESLRLVSVANEAFDRLGRRDHARRYIVVREGRATGWGARDTVLIARDGFTSTDVALGKEKIREGNLTAAYLPDEEIPGDFTRFLRTADPKQFIRSYRYDISPVTDDRPFFFYTARLRDALRPFSAAADYKINRAIVLLLTAVLAGIAATAIILLLPRVLLNATLPHDSDTLWFLVFFVAIGVAYTIVQVALIQRFVVYLGHPTYAVTVVVFAMLIISGIGSLFSRGISRTTIALAGAACALSAIALAMSPAMEASIGWPKSGRIIMSIGLLAPAAFLMGMPFPIGISRLDRVRTEAVRWAWGVNAAASVLGSSCAVLLSVYVGIRGTVLCGAALYCCALLVWSLRLERTVKTTQPAPLQ